MNRLCAFRDCRGLWFRELGTDQGPELGQINVCRFWTVSGQPPISDLFPFGIEKNAVPV